MCCRENLQPVGYTRFIIVFESHEDVKTGSHSRDKRREGVILLGRGPADPQLSRGGQQSSVLHESRINTLEWFFFWRDGL